MSKFEAELRLPCKQPYAYINIVVRGESAEELKDLLEDATQGLLAGELAAFHGVAYDVVMGNKPKPAAPQQDAATLITQELKAKVLEDKPTEPAAPWERPKPATAAVSDPFANF